MLNPSAVPLPFCVALSLATQPVSAVTHVLIAVLSIIFFWILSVAISRWQVFNSESEYEHLTSPVFGALGVGSIFLHIELDWSIFSALFFNDLHMFCRYLHILCIYISTCRACLAYFMHICAYNCILKAFFLHIPCYFCRSAAYVHIFGLYICILLLILACIVCIYAYLLLFWVYIAYILYTAYSSSVSPLLKIVVFNSKELTNWDLFAGISVMRCSAILKHKEKGHFILNTQVHWSSMQADEGWKSLSSGLLFFCIFENSGKN